MVFKSEVILAVGAHPDDIELGCGGTLCAAVEAGKRVIAVFMTKGEQSGVPEVRVKENTDALCVLGVKEVFFGDSRSLSAKACRRIHSQEERGCRSL
jgi:LmbE family N-acetylglucosaminyl deacetylase